MNLLSALNDRQRLAAATTEGALLILAGAGSGKTRVITYRIAHLIAEKDVPPYNILAVTFTNKAAGEMRERVEKLLRETGVKLNSAPLVTTFHSLCVRILRVNIEKLEQGYTRAFTIYDQDDSTRIIKACLKDLGYDDQRLGARNVQSAISASKNSGLDAELYAARVESSDERKVAISRAFKLYEDRLRSNNALDFDDLLIKAVSLLRKDEATRARYNDRFRYILIDEYQDTNALQFALIRYLTEKTQNVCVVGDEDQSIYKWRGADISNILNFEQHYPEANIVRLEQNYRSTQNILDTAGAVVRNNTERKGKTLWTSNTAGDSIRYYQAIDGDAEARFVAAKIDEHLRRDKGARCAILYRTNSQSRVFEEALRRAGIAYNIVGGFSFYERAEVRDVVSYLKLALNPQDNIALLRVINSPARGLGKTTLDELDRQARDYGMSLWETILLITNGESANNRLAPRAVSALKNFHNIITHLVTVAAKEPASEVVKAAILDTGYSAALKAENTDEAEARIENLQELVNAAVDFDDTEDDDADAVSDDAIDEDSRQGLRSFIDSAALSSDTDKIESDAKVTMLTVHSAKGLEFPVVFIVGLEDGLFPHSRSASDKAELEEERRLMYVAITRAERFLYVSHAMRRRVYGEEMASEPSQFLNEMPLDLMEDLTRGASWLSFARNSSRTENAHAARALRGETTRSTVPKTSPAKTYDSVESIAEFFRQRGTSMSGGSSSRPSSSSTSPKQRASSPSPPPSNDITPGTHVRHPKYGRGLVLRREGVGDAAKLTVSFPGYGQKKLIEKFAGLEKA
ncbi:MAG: UvrD-helicase domain-containing protein [Pyrinomonadaceae bacterium MAG19_C2-C3]|nr:UvrD-helicase domain-containing protein [Pyrinomonadaceae bacterium MAG19_C2-C3]